MAVNVRFGDDDLLALLMAERDRHLRFVARIPDGIAIDLSRIKLPEGALMFPNPGDDFTASPKPRVVPPLLCHTLLDYSFS
jgi:hypothetical protein